MPVVRPSGECAFRNQYGRSLIISGNNERDGCKIAGKIVERSGKILDNPEFMKVCT